MIFEDDPYVDIRFRGESLPTMLGSTRTAATSSTRRSFSKTVCPGIRVGYLVGPAEMIAAIVKMATDTYISPSMVAQSIVNEFCRSGAIDPSIATVQRGAARARRRAGRGARARAARRALRGARRRLLPLGRAARGADVDALRGRGRARRAVRQGLGLHARGRRARLRLAYSGVTVEQIEEGVRRLAAATGALV